MIRLAAAILLVPAAASAQLFTPSILAPLSTTLNETSGLVQVNGEVWTHNDSGGPPRLFQVDPSSGAVLRSVNVEGAVNVDWEEITADDQWLYIGDVGNNNGDRTDLRVLRVALDSLLNPQTNSVGASTIAFQYDLQTDFTPAPNNTDWDCEALVAFNDSLWLFSKNWVSGTSHISVLPAVPGTHTAVRVDTLASQGMVTGASYDPATGDVALIGYTNGLFLPFAMHLQQVDGAAAFDGAVVREDIALLFTQFEGIAWNAPGTVLLSNERSALVPARLWSMTVELSTGTPGPAAATAMRVMPVPAAGTLQVHAAQAGEAALFDVHGRMILRIRLGEGANTIHLPGQPSGVYVLRTPGGAASFAWMP